MAGGRGAGAAATPSGRPSPHAYTQGPAVLTTATRAWRRASVRRNMAWPREPPPKCRLPARGPRGRPDRRPRLLTMDACLLVPRATVWAERAAKMAAMLRTLVSHVVNGSVQRAREAEVQAGGPGAGKEAGGGGIAPPKPGYRPAATFFPQPPPHAFQANWAPFFLACIFKPLRLALESVWEARNWCPAAHASENLQPLRHHHHGQGQPGPRGAHTVQDGIASKTHRF